MEQNESSTPNDRKKRIKEMLAQAKIDVPIERRSELLRAYTPEKKVFKEAICDPNLKNRKFTEADVSRYMDALGVKREKKGSVND